MSLDPEYSYILKLLRAYAVSLALPFALLRAMTLRPPGVAILALNP